MTNRGKQNYSNVGMGNKSQSGRVIHQSVVMIFITSVAFNMFSDGLRTAMDVK